MRGDVAHLGRALYCSSSPKALKPSRRSFRASRHYLEYLYYNWFLNHDFIALAATGIVSQFLETFKEFPPRAKAASFSIDEIVESMMPKS